MKILLLLLLISPLFVFPQKKDKYPPNVKKAEILYKQGYHADKTGQYDSALYYYNKSILLYPSSVTYRDRAWLKRTYMKDFNGAFEDYTKAIEKCGNDSELKSTCYYDRASLRIDLRDYAGAIIDCNSAFKANPKDEAIIYSLRGEAKYYSDDYMGAISDCNTSITDHPGSFYEPYCFRALAEIKLNQHEKACQDLRVALNTAGGDSGWVQQLIKDNCN
jgi:tetratricopeptide (TPR) repeat protein